MSRTKSQDVMIAALGERRRILKMQIDALQATDLAAMQAELVEIELALKAIDPTIQSLEEAAAGQQPP